jgi:hypothetical protein
MKKKGGLLRFQVRRIGGGQQSGEHVPLIIQLVFYK